MKTKLLILVFGMLLLSQFAAADALISVSTVSAGLNSTANVDVSISGVPDIYAVQFDFFFNPAGLSITGDTPGSLFTIPGGFTSIGAPTIDNVGGSYTTAGYT